MLLFKEGGRGILSELQILSKILADDQINLSLEDTELPCFWRVKGLDAQQERKLSQSRLTLEPSSPFVSVPIYHERFELYSYIAEKIWAIGLTAVAEDDFIRISNVKFVIGYYTGSEVAYLIPADEDEIAGVKILDILARSVDRLMPDYKVIRNGVSLLKNASARNELADAFATLVGAKASGSIITFNSGAQLRLNKTSSKTKFSIKPVGRVTGAHLQALNSLEPFAAKTALKH